MYALVNKFGLYLMSLSANRNDYGFTKEKSLALTFYNKDEAEKKCNALKRFQCSIQEV